MVWSLGPWTSDLEMQPLLSEGYQAPRAKERPICCRGAFALGAIVGVLVSLGGVAIALWQLGDFGAAPPLPDLAGNASLLGCTLPSDVQIMLKQGNTWESDGGNQFLNAQQDCMKKQIIEGADAGELARQAARDGVLTLRQAAIKKLALGLTSFDEVLRVTVDSGY